MGRLRPSAQIAWYGNNSWVPPEGDFLVPARKSPIRLASLACISSADQSRSVTLALLGHHLTSRRKGGRELPLARRSPCVSPSSHRRRCDKRFRLDRGALIKFHGIGIESGAIRMRSDYRRLPGSHCQRRLAAKREIDTAWKICYHKENYETRNGPWKTCFKWNLP